MDFGKEVLYLTKKNIQELNITMQETLDVLDMVFTAKGNGRFEMPVKIGIHPQGDDFLHAMPSWLPDYDVAGQKWVSGFFNNRKLGLPVVNGLLTLNSTTTGVPLAIMDCSHITTLRTGGSAGYSAKLFANEGSSTVGILGCGVQGRSSLEAIKTAVPSVQIAYVYDYYPEVAERYAADLCKRLDMEVVAVKTPYEAVANADILTTACPIFQDHRNAVITPDWLKKGVTIATVDLDAMFTRGTIDACVDKLFTDDVPAYNASYDSQRDFIAKQPVEMGEARVGKYPMRTSADEIIFCMNLGIGLEDILMGKRIFERALEKGVGRFLPL